MDVNQLPKTLCLSQFQKSLEKESDWAILSHVTALELISYDSGWQGHTLQIWLLDD